MKLPFIQESFEQKIFIETLEALTRYTVLQVKIRYVEHDFETLEYMKVTDENITALNSVKLLYWQPACQ